MNLSRLTYNILCLSTILLSCAIDAHATGSIPSGTLHRIGVNHTGIFQITPSQLEAMGFDSPDEVAVYGYGGVEGHDFNFDKNITGLPEIPTMTTTDGRVLFYGEGTERYRIHTTGIFHYTDIECNPNDTMGYYFVGRKSNPRHIETLPAEPTGKTFTSHSSVAAYHPQCTNPAHAGSFFAGEDFSKSQSKSLTVTFPTPDCTPGGTANFRVRGALKATKYTFGIQALSANRTFLTISRRNILDDIEAYFNSTDYYEIACYTPSSLPDSIPVTTTLTQAGTVAYAAIESLTISYTRDNRMPADGTPLSMYYHNINPGDAIAIDATDDNTCLWDVTDLTNPVALQLNTTTGTTATAAIKTGHPGACNYIAFNPDGKLGDITITGPTTIGHLSAMAVPDMVLLTAPAYRNQAERLASLHRDYQGLDVAIVEPQEVYNEFGSGVRSAYAIRAFMKSLYDREPAKLKHLLIMASSIYDPCGRTTGLSLDDTHILTYQIEDYYKQGDAATCYATDAFFAMLDTDKSPANIMGTPMLINVGRIPCSNLSQAIAYVDKAERYITDTPATDTWSRAMFIGDHGDSNGHLKQAVEACDSIELRWAPEATVTRAMSAMFQPANGNISPQLDKIKSTLDSGIGYFSYSGHGNPQNIGTGILITNAMANAFTNTCYPFTMLATCYATGFDRNENTIGEQLLMNPHGGSIAIVGSGRAVQMSYNQYINLAVARAYYNTTGYGYTGDVFRLARNQIMSRNYSNELATNTACYNLLGDPALPLYSPTHSIELDSESTIDITPLSHNTITGRVTTPDGTTDSNFNGRVIFNLYAPAYRKLAQYDRKGCDTISVTCRDKLLTTASGTITNGMFTAQLDCPVTAYTGDQHRLTVHAISSDGINRAATVSEAKVNEMTDNPELDTHEAPVIEQLWINTPEFANGDLVDNDMTLCATIIPSTAGLSLINTVDRTNYLSIDGIHHNDIVTKLSFDSDGKATLKYNIPQLADGPHTVTLSVVDNAGNRSNSTINFTVVNCVENITLEVPGKAVNTEATIGLNHPFSDAPQCRLLIEDSAGNTVFSKQGVSFPYSWNLEDNDGNPVSDGRYTIRVMVKSNLRHGAATPATITVINENIY